MRDLASQNTTQEQSVDDTAPEQPTSDRRAPTTPAEPQKLERPKLDPRQAAAIEAILAQQRAAMGFT